MFPQNYDLPGFETDLHNREKAAYMRLQEHGLCARGIVPQFYGATDELDPTLYRPHLDMFLGDEHPPAAILLEYIPNMQQLHWTNYTKDRTDNFVDCLARMHQALVTHLDVHPRNMMIVENDPKRAIWLDFDRAETFDGNSLTDKDKYWIDFERALVVEVGEFMVPSLTNSMLIMANARTVEV